MCLWSGIIPPYPSGRDAIILAPAMRDDGINRAYFLPRLCRLSKSWCVILYYHWHHRSLEPLWTMALRTNHPWFSRNSIGKLYIKEQQHWTVPKQCQKVSTWWTLTQDTIDKYYSIMYSEIVSGKESSFKLVLDQLKFLFMLLVHLYFASTDDRRKLPLPRQCLQSINEQVA